MTTRASSNCYKALLFDVFGTLVDWRTTVTNQLSSRASSAHESSSRSISDCVRESAFATDWASFAQNWRDSYLRFCSEHKPSSIFVSVDQHHHDSLITLLAEYGVEALWTREEEWDISRIWHFLEPWPDSVNGLKELNRLGITTCTLSNGNTSLQRDLTGYAGLEVARLFSAEDFKTYKPDPSTYLGAVERLGLQPKDCAMVAAHLGDLDAARKLGLGTIYIERKGEETWSHEEVMRAKEQTWVNIWIDIKTTSEGGGVAALAKLVACSP